MILEKQRMGGFGQGCSFLFHSPLKNGYSVCMCAGGRGDKDYM